MFRFHRIIVCDVDEVILPQKHMRLSDLVSAIEDYFANRTKPPVNYIFRNNYFLLEASPFSDVPQNSTFLRYRMRAPVNNYGYVVKSMLNPLACLQMRSHSCERVAPAYKMHGVGQYIDPSLAVSQHYRTCGCDDGKNGEGAFCNCTQLLSHSQRDDTMLRFRDALIPRVAEKVRVIFGKTT